MTGDPPLGRLLTAEDVVRRIAAECAFISANGEVGIGCGRPPLLCASMATSFAGRRHGGGRGGRRIQTCFDSVYDLVQFSRNQKEDSGDVMNIEEIIQKPITTHEYPDPTEARRYICDDDGFYGYDYVFLEDVAEVANRSYWPSQASSKRQPLKRLLTMIVIPCTAGDRQVPSR